MGDFENELFSADVKDVVHALGAERPAPTEIELDRIKVRALASHDRYKGQVKGLMRLRLSMALALTLGVLMTGAGAGLAVSGGSGSGSAGIAQYGGGPGGGGPAGGAAGGGPGGGDVAGETEGGGQGVLGEEDAGGNEGNEEAAAPAAAANQLGDNDDSLPFTGYAAIPVLLLGIGLLGTGFVLRRRVGALDS
jgi:hypothetical protein